MGGRLLCTYTFISVLLAWHTSAKVIILTDENFDHQTQQGTWLIEAHSPWYGVAMLLWYVALLCMCCFTFPLPNPRCHLCKELAPIWERLADELEGEQYVAKVCTVWMYTTLYGCTSHCMDVRHMTPTTQIDVTQQRVLLQRFAIQGFPAIFHLKDGATREYEGHRTFKEVLAGG